jgi:hypothetical protein
MDDGAKIAWPRIVQWTSAILFTTANVTMVALWVAARHSDGWPAFATFVIGSLVCCSVIWCSCAVAAVSYAMTGSGRRLFVIEVSFAIFGTVVVLFLLIP